MTDTTLQRGPVIGSYLNYPIHEWMQWGQDRLYYKGIAHADRRGNINLDQLGEREQLVVPGLIYAPLSAV